MRSCILFFAFWALHYAAIAQSTVSTNGTRYVLFENMNSAGVFYSPDADIITTQIEANTPTVISVNFHRSYSTSFVDSMEIPASSDFFSAYLTGYPMATADRSLTSASSNIAVAKNLYNAAVSSRVPIPPTYDLTLNHNYNPLNRQISIVLTGTSLTALFGDYRFNVYIIEDSVSKVGVGYNQRNSFYNTQSGHPAFGLGDPIVGYSHPEVVRAVLATNIWGDFAVSNPAANNSVTQNFTYTVPADFNPARIKLVAMVMKYGSTPADRAIQNAVRAELVTCPEPESVQICGATVNETTGKIDIYWDKTGIDSAVSFNIYRESDTPGKYNFIGSTLATSPGVFTDGTATPGIKPYRYKISLVSTCGIEKDPDLSVPHKTIRLYMATDINGNAVLTWNAYEGLTLSGLELMRSTGGGPFTSIAQLSPTANVYADTNPPVGSVYRIEAAIPGHCGIAKLMSNRTAFTTSIANAGSNNRMSLYPNPANNVFYLDGVDNESKIVLRDISGRVLRDWERAQAGQGYDISELSSGLYFINVYDKEGVLKANLKLQH